MKKIKKILSYPEDLYKIIEKDAKKNPSEKRVGVTQKVIDILEDNYNEELSKVRKG